MPYPLRIVRKGSILVEVVHEPWKDHTGITDRSPYQLNVISMVDTGIYVYGVGMIAPRHIDWDGSSGLWKYRALEIRKGRSQMPGRSWQTVERWYLHKINVDATIKAWGAAMRAGEDPEFYRAPLAHEWRIQ